MKPLRRLNSALLARKGSAAPSTDMHPEDGLLDRMVAPLPFSQESGGSHESNGTGSPTEQGTNPSIYAGVHSRPRISIRKPAEDGQRGKIAGKKDAGKPDRVAMTVRMDEEQHIKLKVYCAHAKKSAQDVFLEALDAFIESHQDDAEMVDCACFRSSKKSPAK